MAYRSSSHVQLTGTVPKPTGTVSGDVLAVGLFSNAPITTVPSGWTLQETFNQSSVYLTVYTLVAGGSEPSSYTWAASGGTIYDAGIECHSGRDTTTPVTGTSKSASGGSGSTAIPSITAAAGDDLVAFVTGYAFGSDGTGLTPPGTMTERWEENYANTFFFTGNDQLNVSAGATGTRTFTLTGTLASGSLVFGVMLALAAPALTTQTVSDSGTITGTDSVSITASRTVSDSGTITSVESARISFFVSDSGTISSIETTSRSSARTVADSGTITSTETQVGNASRAVTDSGLITGTDTQSQSVSRSVSDSGTITSVETTIRSAVLAVSDTGTIMGTDAIVTATARNVSDSGLLSSTESVGTTVSFIVSDSGTITAVLTSVAGLYVPAARIGGLSRVLGNFNVIVVTREGVALSIGTARIPHGVVFQASRADHPNPLGITREESSLQVYPVRSNPELDIAVARMLGVEDVHVHRVIFEDLTD